MLWDIPYSTNSNVIPGISIMMGHSRRPPQRIPIQLNVTKFGFQIILIYLPATTIVYTFPFIFSLQNTTKRKELFPLKRTTFVYVLSSDW
jgi:hypothetical protein